MKHATDPGSHCFFATAPIACPYLSGRMERRLVAELTGDEAAGFHDVLSQSGFRRSHRFAYVPVCRDCTACATVRVVAPAFRPTRTQTKLWRRNADIVGMERPPQATYEQFALFSTYQGDRHGGGEMSRMDFFDYQALVEDTPVDTVVVEFREPFGELVAACITDRLGDGLSAVYSFFNCDHPQRSLGTHMILWLIDRARQRRQRHVYLGFWVAGCDKMSYKAGFQPLEAYTPEGWRPLRADDPDTTRPFHAGGD